MRYVLWLILIVYAFRALLEVSYGKYFKPGLVWDCAMVCLLDGGLLACGNALPGF